jgi:hypothetical protein
LGGRAGHLVADVTVLAVVVCVVTYFTLIQDQQHLRRARDRAGAVARRGAGRAAVGRAAGPGLWAANLLPDLGPAINWRRGLLTR